MPMVVKRCPSCQGGLPVACKTCPCGHVFLAKKPIGKPSERKAEVLPGRLRPERPRREKFVFHDVSKLEQEHAFYNHAMHSAQLQQQYSIPSISPHPKSSHSMDMYGGVNQYLHTQPYEFVEDDQGHGFMSKKRGRPKGSKDKKPRVPRGCRSTTSTESGEYSSGNSGLVLKVGRSHRQSEFSGGLSPHNGDDEMSRDYNGERDDTPAMSSEKQELFSMILQDINSKIARQRFRIT